MAQFEPAARGMAFIHVMKTGGMTFRSLLSALYGSQFHVCESPDLPSIEADLARYQCVEFHVHQTGSQWCYLHRDIVQKRRWDLLNGRDIFVMFRDPVDQVLSMYYFMVKIRKQIEPSMTAAGIPFPESINDFLDRPGNLNNQLGFLVGKTQQECADVNPHDVALAKEMLVCLRAHVGLTERYADSLHIFEQVTGNIIPGRNIANRNENAARPPAYAVSSKVRDRIRELNAFDIELYQFAKQVFEQEHAFYGPTPAFNFAGVRKANRGSQTAQSWPAGSLLAPEAGNWWSQAGSDLAPSN